MIYINFVQLIYIWKIDVNNFKHYMSIDIICLLDIININLYDYITHTHPQTHTPLSKCVTKQNGLQFYPMVLVAGPRSGARTCFHPSSWGAIWLHFPHHCIPEWNQLSNPTLYWSKMSWFCLSSFVRGLISAWVYLILKTQHINSINTCDIFKYQRDHSKY